MALSVKDGAGASQTLKSTLSGSDHVVHHIIDSGSVSITGTPSVSITGTPTISGTVSISGSVAVTGTFWQATQPVSLASLPALPAGTNNIGDVDVLSLPALPAGSNNIGDVDVLSVVPGTGATSLGKAEDAAHASGDTGVMVLAVRNDGGATMASTNGDYIPLSTDAAGQLRVNAFVQGAVTTWADGFEGSVWTSQGFVAMGYSGSVTKALKVDSSGELQIDVLSVVPGTGATNLGKAEDAAHASGDTGVMGLAVRHDAGGTLVGATGDYSPLQVDANGALRVTGGGGGTEYTEDIAAAADPSGGMMMAVRADTPATITSTDGDNIALRATNKGALYVQQTEALPAGTNNIGDVDVLTLPATPAGTNLIGKAAVGPDISAVYAGTTALTPKFANIDTASSGDNQLVAAVASKKIVVLAMQLVLAKSATAVGAYLRDDSGSPVNLYGGTGKIPLDPAGLAGHTLPFCPVGWFKTTAGEGLQLNLDAAQRVVGVLVYAEE